MKLDHLTFQSMVLLHIVTRDSKFLKKCQNSQFLQFLQISQYGKFSSKHFQKSNQFGIMGSIEADLYLEGVVIERVAIFCKFFNSKWPPKKIHH